MNPWRAWLATFLGTILVALSALPFVGNALPSPHGSFIPMLEGHDFVRDEFVRAHALKETSSPCVAFFGDSRTAFNISAAVVDQSLPADCRSQNYGFASLKLPAIASLIGETEPGQTAVISVSETMLTASEATVLEVAVRPRWIRFLYLGAHRFHHWFRPKFDNVWRWSSNLKRWLFAGIEERRFISVPAYEQEAAALADNYFAHRPFASNELASLLKLAAARSRRVIVVLPPSEARFRQSAERHGHQQRVWEMIVSVTRDAGAMLIDCSTSCVSQDGFGDPVHLNAEGSRAYSAHLAKQIAGLVASTRAATFELDLTLLRLDPLTWG